MNECHREVSRERTGMCNWIGWKGGTGEDWRCNRRGQKDAIWEGTEDCHRIELCRGIGRKGATGEDGRVPWERMEESLGGGRWTLWERTEECHGRGRKSAMGEDGRVPWERQKDAMGEDGRVPWERQKDAMG